MTVYEKKEQCTGCRACEQICSKSCISMEQDEEGFYYPVIDETICVNCNQCRNVCERNLILLKQQYEVRTLAVRNRVLTERMEASSGGTFFELGKLVIHQGGVVFGAVFDENFKVKHDKAETLESLQKMRGSKYVQSDIGHTYIETRQMLELDKWVLYSGTPCQIAGLKKFLGKQYNKLVCVAIFCHSVCSPMVWDKYMDELRKQGTLKGIRLRDKSKSWHNYSVSITYEEETKTEEHDKSLYMNGFLQGLYSRPSCYECDTKTKYCGADIMLGDYWGIEKYHAEFDDDKGVSAVLLCTSKGECLFDKIKDCFDIMPTCFKYIEKENAALTSSIKRSIRRKRFFQELYEVGDLFKIIERNLKKPITDKERSLYTYPTILQYLRMKVAGYSIGSFLNKYGYRKVALYAITDLMEIVYEDLKNNDSMFINNLIICDKNYTMFQNGYKGKTVIGITQLVNKYISGEIDCVVVCNLISENAIIDELVQTGCRLEDVLSLNSIVYGLGD